MLQTAMPSVCQDTIYAADNIDNALDRAPFVLQLTLFPMT